jgi:hypothetical protein
MQQHTSYTTLYESGGVRLPVMGNLMSPGHAGGLCRNLHLDKVARHCHNRHDVFYMFIYGYNLAADYKIRKL